MRCRHHLQPHGQGLPPLGGVHGSVHLVRGGLVPMESGSNSLDADFCVQASEEALGGGKAGGLQHGPEPALIWSNSSAWGDKNLGSREVWRFMESQAAEELTAFANSEHPTLPRPHHESNQAPFEIGLSQSPTSRTTIPEAKTHVGGDCSTQVERTTLVLRPSLKYLKCQLVF